MCMIICVCEGERLYQRPQVGQRSHLPADVIVPLLAAGKAMEMVVLQGMA